MPVSMTCPKCSKQMEYKNQDYVSHGWYCECGNMEKCSELCCNRYLLINKDEAEAHKLVNHYRRNTVQVIVQLEKGVFSVVACDGGEPEDQLFCRDLDWIVPELNAAYEAGYRAGKLGGGSDGPTG